MEQKSLFDEKEIQVNSKPKTLYAADNYQSIVLQSDVIKDEYTDYIAEAFDLHVGSVSKVCVPNKLRLETLKDWNIGVICGASGSGKSTILKHLAQKMGGGNFKPLIRQQQMSYIKL